MDPIVITVSSLSLMEFSFAGNRWTQSGTLSIEAAPQSSSSTVSSCAQREELLLGQMLCWVDSTFSLDI